MNNKENAQKHATVASGNSQLHEKPFQPQDESLQSVPLNDGGKVLQQNSNESDIEPKNNGKTKKEKYFSARRIAWFAVLLALVAVLQLFASTIKIGVTSFSLVLVPIVLGAMMLGPIAGGVLGFAFGLIVYLNGALGTDPFTFILFTDHPFLTALVCFGKGIAAGVGAGLIYLPFKRRKKYLGTLLSSAAAPVLNTGLFILGALLMSDTLSANFVGEGQTVIYFLVIGCAGVNFIVEFLVNVVLASGLYRVIEIVGKRKY